MTHKIILTGTHHSGKSTIINEYKDHPKLNIMGELVRSLSQEPNFKFTPEDVDKWAFSELALIHFYYGMAQGKDLLPTKNIWLFDRCIIDPLYYIQLFKIDVPLIDGGTLYTKALQLNIDLIHKGYYKDATVLLLKPIPIKEHDGFRLDAGAQEGAYKIAINTLDTLGIKYIIVDTKEAREIIESKIK